MANKKIYYYTISLREMGTNRNVNANIRAIFDNVFDRECVDNNGIRSMTLVRENENISLDILHEDEHFMFGRVGKEKDISDAIIRDTNTKGYEYVLEGAELEYKTLEICTYFLLDYTHCIVGFILGKSAPSVYSLVNIVNGYDAMHMMTIDNIASPENVRALLNPGSTLGKIKYSVRVPNTEILRYLGLNRRQIVALRNTNVYEAELVIKNRPRRNLTEDLGAIDTVVTAFSELPDAIKDTLSMTGRTANSTSQQYKFTEQDIVYSVDVPTAVNEDGQRRRLTVDEVANEVYNRLERVHRENIQHLIRFANIE